jgi:hypothetical protein
VLLAIFVAGAFLFDFAGSLTWAAILVDGNA